MGIEYPGDITELLACVQRGEVGAADALMDLVYSDLKHIAVARLAGNSGGTMCPTALVHECYLRLFGESSNIWSNRRHFFAVATKAMRQIIIDHARRMNAQKRGGGAEDDGMGLPRRSRRLSLDQHEVTVSHQYTELLALDEALTRLAQTNPLGAEIVQYRYFAGLTVKETAAVLEIAPNTVRKEWSYARARLHRDLDPGGSAGEQQPGDEQEEESGAAESGEPGDRGDSGMADVAEDEKS